MRIDKNTTIRLGDRNIVKVKLGDVVIWQKSTGPVVGPDYFYIESLGDGNTVSVKNKGNGNTDNLTPTLEYSTDKNTWNTITFDWTSGEHTTELPIKLNTGGKMYFRNDTRLFSNSYNKYITFSSSVSSNVGGDIRTLSNYLDVNSETTVQSNMFRNLFNNNKYIVDASNLRLPYTTLAGYCYHNMFGGCSSLTTAPTLPATTLAPYCYQYMFNGCTSLTTAPELPATTLASSCYDSMFYKCSSLTTAPALLATTLASYCYSSMFNGCTSLTTTPTLPAITLVNSCYSGMFRGCTSLTTAPTLPATTLAEYCYGQMFQNCSSLNSITVYADDISASNCTNNWLSNVASSGTFHNLGSATYPTGASGIPTGWTEVKPVVGPDYFYIESLGDGNTISLINKGDGSTTNVTPTLEYSTDKNTWNTITFDWTSGEHTTELPVKLNTGGKMYFRNDTRLFSNSYDKYISFSSTVSSNVGGDIRTLSNYLDVDNETKPREYMFQKLFYNNKYIVDASNLKLPYNTIENYCYISMFYGCTSLTSAPTELPATTLKMYCYSSMFSGCTSLISIPVLPATNLDLGCYTYMFKGCTSLTSVPELPSTTIASSCYQSMFEGCTSLTTAPELPATTTKQYCYNSMFKGCTSLTSAPELPATTLEQYCYSSMFDGCTSLTSAPALPSTTLASNCCSSMFRGCTSLTSAPTELPATTLATECYYGMFYGCTKLTSAPALPSTTLASSCYQSMFSGCTSLTSAPELPATTLKQYCYSSMFDGCTSLTTAPTLPSTTLENSCYSSMFYNCRKLKSVTVYAQDISASNCTNNWLSGVASSGTFNNMGFASFSKGASGIPNNWTEIAPEIQSITANPDTFTIKSYNKRVKCESTLTITTTIGTTVTQTNTAIVTVGENTGDSTRTLTETIPYKGSSYQVTIVQTANDVKPAYSWNVVSTGTYPFELNSNGYYESTNKGKSSSYSYATLNYEGFEELILECINSGESNYDYGIISQPDVLLSESTSDDGATGSTKVFKNFKGESSTNPVQLTIPSDGGSHFITIKFRKDGSGSNGNDSLQFMVIEP